MSALTRAVPRPCPACGGSHDTVTLRELRAPVVAEGRRLSWTWECPRTRQTMLCQPNDLPMVEAPRAGRLRRTA